MRFGVGFLGCGSGRVHVVAPLRRSFLVVRVAFFPHVGWGGAALSLTVRCGYWCGGWVSCAFGACPCGVRAALVVAFVEGCGVRWLVFM